MGKKGNWLSLLKRVFIPSSSGKTVSTVNALNVKPEEAAKERKKWGFVKLKHNGPSSIEKILQEAEREGRVASTVVAAKVEEEKRPPPPPSSRRRAAEVQQAPRPNSNHRDAEQQQQQQQQGSPQHTRQPKAAEEFVHSAARPNSYTKVAGPSSQHAAAIKIQTAFRGYLARRSFRAIKGLIRLQSMLKSPNVLRQTMNTMKCMQQLVRVQTEINARRLQMLESPKVFNSQSLQKNETELELSRSNLQEDWDYSVLTKEETDTRVQRKVEATIHRERALAYAYSHQASKGMSKSAQALIMELRSAKLPWGWNWIEQQASNQTPDRLATSGNPKLASVNVRPTSSGSRRTSLAFEPSLDEPTPRYSRSPLGIRSAKGPKPASVDGSPWHRHHRVVAATPLRDDESMTSCPPLASPNYMVPTISAKAKIRSQVSPSAKSQGLEPTKRRLSFASARSPFSSLSWGKGSIFTSKEANSRGPLGLNMGMHSPGRLSIDSTMSLPVGVGRKSFR
ncbi:protein IQ-DOMAIN 13 [Nymphaea colorata]|nr:protein IQ-DOMAIN 13 [Nymphaea colorata]XP_031477022.1 protein IQ-DOMAIN 13 [Nymphaea colorata]XP_031477023.1 protein IQ-DOMAIN 13 [Nymphaea colorata]